MGAFLEGRGRYLQLLTAYTPYITNRYSTTNRFKFFHFYLLFNFSSKFAIVLIT